MAALKEMPFGRYYGSVDATPLFVLLAGAYYERTGDRAFVESLWPNVEAALRWIDRYGDRDGDGFVEYQRQSADGLAPPGLEGLRRRRLPRRRHAGPTARSPCARCRATSTRRGAPAAALAAVLGTAGARGGADAAGRGAARAVRAGVLVRGPVHLRPGPGRRQAALPGADVERRAVPVHRHRQPRARPARGADAAWPRSRSPAGACARWPRPRARYNPMALPQRLGLAARQRPDRPGPGALRPAETGAADLDRAVRGRAVLRPAPDAGAVLRLRRRSPARGRSSTRWPAPRRPGRRRRCSCSCRPAWAWRSTASRRRSASPGPQLPASLGELRIHNLEVAGATVDLLLVRHEHDVGVNVLRREGDVQILVVK